ncbi:hypothetical protein WN48_10642 [Eufriesea mexicana]|uniref:Uncharacterized protein n=1 Tax=Eufriesea mexicana TaxID=516756 RepID=A0A310SD36_9HYME|nr:hypothetical protein WN48_10642 [Eufriesea mexicana]
MEHKRSKQHRVYSAAEISEARHDDRDLTECVWAEQRVGSAMAEGGGRNEPQLRKMRTAN